MVSESAMSGTGAILLVVALTLGALFVFADLSDETTLRWTTAALVAGPVLIAGSIFIAAGKVVDALTRHRR